MHSITPSAKNAATDALGNGGRLFEAAFCLKSQ
jgi:hypothetical protein